MKISEIIETLETIAPPALQESYDNAGLLTGNAAWDCTGVLCTLDATEAIILEAKATGCNLVVAHHPIIFTGLKKINGKNYVEKAVIAAIKNDIAIYAIHTNLDNVLQGVNGKIANTLGLVNCKILSPKSAQLAKLFTFVPVDFIEKIQEALYQAGAGNIGQYSQVSFTAEGTGHFTPSVHANPFSGNPGQPQKEKEIKLEVVFPAYLQQKIVAALREVHPYEEVAYDIVTLANESPDTGSGLVGELAEPVTETFFLQKIQQAFGLKAFRHTDLLNKKVQRIALCGGAGSFLIGAAIRAGADFYISSDIKYHEFFDAENRLVIADIGHWESEQFTIDLLHEILQAKFPTFAVLKSTLRTNPVHYFV